MSEYTVKKLTSPHKITLYKNGSNPNIYYYLTWNKRSYRGSTGTSDRQQSIDKVTEIFYEITHDIRKKGRPLRFENVCIKFLEHKKREGLSDKTFREYTRQTNYLTDFFKYYDVESLGKKSVYTSYQNWRFQYYETHEDRQRQVYKKGRKKVSGRSFTQIGNTTVNRELRLLVSILRFSKEYLDLFKNQNISSYTLLPEKRREDTLTKEEYLRLEDYWMKHNPYYWNIISFVNNTGIRYPSELNKIQWKDVNLEKGYVLIRDRKNKKKNETLTTAVPLIGTGRKIIEELKEREGISKEQDDFVFVKDNGKRIKDIRKGFKRSLIECSIDSSFTMYSLRHLFTTRMVKRPDIPLMMISHTLGHKDTTMVEKVYGHLRVSDVVKTFQESENRKQEILRGQRERVKQHKTQELQDIFEKLKELVQEENTSMEEE